MAKTQVSDLVIWAGAFAVIFSAVIAAAVAIWRTRALLDSESSRLDKQLAHDRAQTERQELRQVIDETIQAVQNGMYKAVALQEFVQEAGRGQEVESGLFEEARAGLLRLHSSPERISSATCCALAARCVSPRGGR